MSLPPTPPQFLLVSFTLILILILILPASPWLSLQKFLFAFDAFSRCMPVSSDSLASVTGVVLLAVPVPPSGVYCTYRDLSVRLLVRIKRM
jgi:hypothetical protein